VLIFSIRTSKQKHRPRAGSYTQGAAAALAGEGYQQNAMPALGVRLASHPIAGAHLWAMLLL
jgi:hypothetical protein